MTAVVTFALGFMLALLVVSLVQARRAARSLTVLHQAIGDPPIVGGHVRVLPGEPEPPSWVNGDPGHGGAP